MSLECLVRYFVIMLLMDLEKIFKNIVLLDFALLVLMFISAFIQPEEITNISDSLDVGIFGDGYSVLYIAILFGVIIVYFINLILLYRFVSFGKPLYLILFFIGIILGLVSGPVIYTAFQDILNWLGGATGGAILVLLYFSPIKDKFIKQ